MKATADNFIEFVKAEAKKNPERTIDHRTWSTCAVGDFWRESLGKSYHYMDADCRSFKNELIAKSEQLFLDMNSGGMVEGGGLRGGRTYADLARIIDRHIKLGVA